ncbi:Ig-like domain-containing protein [Vibrio fluvialis]|nr:Ig-like domain-containing protein [Vibrio fluvialis]
MTSFGFKRLAVFFRFVFVLSTSMVLVACPNHDKSDIGEGDVQDVQISVDEAIVKGKLGYEFFVGQSEKIKVMTNGRIVNSDELRALRNVSWIVSDETIMKVDESGALVALQVGTVSLKLSINGRDSNEITVNISEPKIVSLQLSVNDVSIPKGVKTKLSAIAFYDNKITRDVTADVSWDVDDGNLATISNAGTLSGELPGVVSIKAYFDGLSSNEINITVRDAEILKIQVTPSTLSFPKGTKVNLSAIATLSDETTQDVTASASWFSSDTNIAVISSTGILTALKVGSVNVTASLSGVTSGNKEVTINPATIVGIQITPATISLAKGLTQPITAIATYSDSTTQDVTSSVLWLSDNASVSTVNENGLLTAQGLGVANILASLDGLKSNASKVTVTDAIVTKLQVTPVTSSIAKGLNQNVTAIATFSDSSTLDVTSKAAWLSSSNHIATVDSLGMVSGNAIGSVEITAYFDGVESNIANLNVTDAAILSIQITPGTVLIEKGGVQLYSAIGSFSDSSTKDITSNVIWLSADTNIATISSSGLLTAESSGDVVVTASLDGVISNKSNVTVTNASITDLQITPALVSLAKGLTQNLTAIAIYSDSSTNDVTQRVSWTSSDTNVATILQSGLVSAEAVGNASITASLDGKVSNTSTIEVTSAVVSSIQVTPISVTLPKGTTESLSAIATFSDLTTQDVTGSVSWSSSDVNVATITTSGIISAENIGTVNIEAALAGVSSNGVAITITDAIIDNIEIIPSSISLAKGTREDLVVEAHFSDSTVKDVTTSVAWSSSDTNIVTILQGGLLTGENVGRAIVHASINGVSSAQADVIVTDAVVTSIDVTPASGSLAKGTTETLSAIANYSDLTTQDVTMLVSWLSDDTKIATITAQGILTGVNVGNANISATLDGVDSNVVPVLVRDAALVSLDISPTPISIAVGLTTKPKAVGTYTDRTTQNLSSTVSWHSDDFSIASVTGDVLKGELVGNTEIFASHEGILSNYVPVEVISAGVVALGTGLKVGSAGTQCLTDGQMGTGYNPNCITYNLNAPDLGFVPEDTYLTLEVSGSRPVTSIQFTGYYRQGYPDALGYWDIYGCFVTTCSNRVLLLSPTGTWNFGKKFTFSNNTVFPFYQFVFSSGPAYAKGGSGSGNFSELVYGFD